MKRVRLGHMGPEASAIGIGCMRIASLSTGEISALIDAALAAGIDLFDHADIYGGGESEALFGKVLRERPGLRESMVLQSKCGIRKGFYDLSAAHIVRATEGILSRLLVDNLDILLLHRPDALMEPEEIAEAFSQLHRQGKVRSFGVSNMNPAQIDMLQQAIPNKLLINQLQFGVAHTGMVDSGICVNVRDGGGASRDAGVLEYCRAKQMTIQAWSPLQYGFFEGIILGSDKYAPLNRQLDACAARHHCTSAAIAIAWILRHPANMQAIVGSTNPGRITEMARWGDISLTREEWYDIYKAAGNRLP